MNKKNNIKKGDEFLCTRDVYKFLLGGYKKGFIYKSEINNCITDDNANKERYIDFDYTCYFQKITIKDDNSFSTILSSINELLEYKDKKYGQAALKPLDIFTNKTIVGSRLDDKLSRVKQSKKLNKNDVADLIGYLTLVCKENNWTNFDEFKD